MARRRFEEPSREASIRPDRIGSLIGRIVQERLVRGFADPRIRGLVSITGVDVSPDLRTAMIRISVLPDRYGPRTLSGLRSVAGLLRRVVRDETSLRRVPAFEFRLDDSLKRAAALDDAIREGLAPGGEDDAEPTAGTTAEAARTPESPEEISEHRRTPDRTSNQTAGDGPDSSEETS
jgi:ribosome-binding factor A